MTQEDIIRMAREAGVSVRPPTLVVECWIEHLERFFRLAYEAGAAAEREACAKVCEDIDPPLDSSAAGDACARAIRARGDK